MFRVTDGSSEGKRYLKQVIDQSDVTHQFFSGTSDYAVYQSNGDNPVQIMVNLLPEQFNSLFFAYPPLVNTFVKWMFVNSTHPSGCEFYLSGQHGDFVDLLNGKNKETYRDLRYVVGSRTGETLIKEDGKFSSIRKLLESEGVSDTQLDYQSGFLQTCCSKLKDVFDREDGLAWLFVDGEAKVKREVALQFKENEYGKNIGPYVQMVLDALIKTHPLLVFFRPYLENHLMSDFSECELGRIQITLENVLELVDKVKQMLKNKVLTALVLGKCDEDGTDNETIHPGINQYIYQNQIRLNKSDVQGIMSPSRTRTEIVNAVQSTEFFSSPDQYDSFSKRMSQTTDELFEVKTNVGLAEKTGLVDETNHRIRLEWAQLRNWLFNEETQSPESILKAFVRTQFYRPNFFKHDNYKTFTSDETAYWCRTEKSYINHDGDTQKLKFNDDGSIDLASSGLSPEYMGYSIENASYGQANNALEYTVKYDEVEIVDDKFVHDDIEFYVTYIQDPIRRVSCIYFNEFTGETRPNNDRIEITDNKFKIDDVDYVIEGGRVRVNATGVDGEPQRFIDEFSQEIVDGKIKVNGISYVFHQEDGEWKWIDFAKADDTKLRRIRVTTHGTATYEEGNMKFQFSSDWNRVQIIKNYYVEVMDRVTSEWCRFDNQSVTIDQDRTFEWYLANELIRFKEQYPSFRLAINDLGNGFLYKGSMLSANFKLGISNELQDGNIVTRAILTKEDPLTGETTKQQLSILFDRQLKMVRKTLLRGDVQEDGIIELNPEHGSSAFLLKEAKAGKNNVNAVWMPWTTWENAYDIVEVGTLTYNEDDKEYAAKWDENVKVELPEMLTIQALYMDSDGETSAEPQGYAINTQNDGVGRYNVNATGNVIHFVANSSVGTPKERYKVVLSDSEDVQHTVYKLVFHEIPVETVDFSTQYTHSQLMQNLLSNVRQYMLNEIVQNMIDVRQEYNQTEISLNPRNIGLHLELFSDKASCEGFCISTGKEETSPEGEKFKQVFKNNLMEIDDSKCYLGKAYGYLSGVVEDVYGSGTSLILVDEPSVRVTRVDPVDKFTYVVCLDLYLMNGKGLLKDKQTYGAYDGHWVAGNAVVKDITCKVEFVPKFSYNKNGLAYDVKYSVAGGSYKAEYN